MEDAGIRAGQCSSHGRWQPLETDFQCRLIYTAIREGAGLLMAGLETDFQCRLIYIWRIAIQEECYGKAGSKKTVTCFDMQLTPYFIL